jgi:hypothetical protein
MVANVAQPRWLRKQKLQIGTKIYCRAFGRLAPSKTIRSRASLPAPCASSWGVQDSFDAVTRRFATYTPENGHSLIQSAPRICATSRRAGRVPCSVQFINSTSGILNDLFQNASSGAYSLSHKYGSLPIVGIQLGSIPAAAFGPKYRSTLPSAFTFI